MFAIVARLSLPWPSPDPFFKKAGKPFKKADEALKADGDELVAEVQGGQKKPPPAGGAVAAKAATQSLVSQERGCILGGQRKDGARRWQTPAMAMICSHRTPPDAATRDFDCCDL